MTGAEGVRAELREADRAAAEDLIATILASGPYSPRSVYGAIVHLAGERDALAEQVAQAEKRADENWHNATVRELWANRELNAARAALARAEQREARVREALTDFAERGVRADLLPTTSHAVSAGDMYLWFAAYLNRVDKGVRERAAAALNGGDTDDQQQ